MTEFSLRAIVRAELDASPVADPHIVAEHVLKQIRPGQRGAALGECLPQFVRVLSNETRTLPAIDHRRGDSSHEPRWRRAAADLSARYFTGDGWKFLRDLTRDDVLACAAQRRDLAAANLAEAERFDALHKLMVERGADTVGDLVDTEALS